MMQNINIWFKLGLYWFNFLEQINHELNWCEIPAKLRPVHCLLHKFISVVLSRLTKQNKTKPQNNPTGEMLL